eukprot:TRINITY_DN26696_c0_g1_i1.p1 TRINITY_DN26696_c0_g1~~TRINITY_DN26696_c0_g1_i1.p1  ORF type:complete len:712 (+),score=148.56 TRINITY_DN26696_c0_g1_i1:70-2136(+)
MAVGAEAPRSQKESAAADGDSSGEDSDDNACARGKPGAATSAVAFGARREADLQLLGKGGTNAPPAPLYGAKRESGRAAVAGRPAPISGVGRGGLNRRARSGSAGGSASATAISVRQASREAGRLPGPALGGGSAGAKPIAASANSVPVKSAGEACFTPEGSENGEGSSQASSLAAELAIRAGSGDEGSETDSAGAGGDGGTGGADRSAAGGGGGGSPEPAADTGASAGGQAPATTVRGSAPAAGGSAAATLPPPPVAPAAAPVRSVAGARALPAAPATLQAAEAPAAPAAPAATLVGAATPDLAAGGRPAQAAGARQNASAPSSGSRRQQPASLVDAMSMAVATVENDADAPQEPAPSKSGSTSARSARQPSPAPAEVQRPATAAAASRGASGQAAATAALAPAGHAKLETPAAQAAQPLTLEDVQRWLFGLTVDPELVRLIGEELAEDGGMDNSSSRRGCWLCRRSTRKGGSAIAGLPRGLLEDLRGDKDFVLFLRATPWTPEDSMHRRMLQTIYCALVTEDDGSPWGAAARPAAPPAVEGQHWRALGIAGLNPSEDLNQSAALLCVVHLFFCLSRHLEVLVQLLELSRAVPAAAGGLPFVPVAGAVTSMVLDCLLSGQLSKLCNQSERGVLDTTCEVFAACLLQMATRLREGRVASWRGALQEVRADLGKRPAKLLAALATHGSA